MQATAQSRSVKILTVPAGNQYSKIETAGISILPSGRFVTPAGNTLRITHDPFGMAISPDGRNVVTLHNGVITIIQLSSFKHTRVPSYDGTIASPLSNGSFLGVAFSSDSKTVFLSGGDNGAVIVYDIEKLQRTDSFSLNATVNGEVYDDSFTSDLLFNEHKNELLVLDRGNFRLVRIDLAAKKISASIKAGRHL